MMLNVDVLDDIYYDEVYFLELYQDKVRYVSREWRKNSTFKEGWLGPHVSHEKWELSQ